MILIMKNDKRIVSPGFQWGQLIIFLNSRHFLSIDEDFLLNKKGRKDATPFSLFLSIPMY